MSSVPRIHSLALYNLDKMKNLSKIIIYMKFNISALMSNNNI